MPSLKLNLVGRLQMIFSYFELLEFAKQAEIDQPHLTENYSNLGAMARRILSFNRPHGSITESPIVRYLELREAMTAVRDPKGVERDLKWRITWYEMLSQAIPEDEIELFCSLLFASSLLSVVRHWYSFDAVGSFSPPYRDQWTEEIQDDPLFQGDYAQAQDCAVGFSSQLEECIQPVWGILNSARFVTSPHSLPTWILDVHRTGQGDQPDSCFRSDKYSTLFKKGVEIFIAKCESEIERMRPLEQEKGRTLIKLFKREARRRYGVCA
jgi:hypothetical protein